MLTPKTGHHLHPMDISGILKGVSAVFFAYIGFDAISTTAEECKNPQRDLPKGMIYSLIICTILYVLLALVLTGMVSYTQLNVGDPLAMVFDSLKLKVACRNYSSQRCICHCQRIARISIRTTPDMDEYEPRWTIT